MTTVVARTFAGTPARDAVATWRAIVDMLAGTADGTKRAELMSVAGVAASLITDKAPADAAITVTCDGPRTRIYCLYDDGAIEGSDANEEPLGFDPLKGDWCVSLPCPSEDLAWVQSALGKLSGRIVARDLADGVAGASARSASSAAQGGMRIDPGGFTGS